MAPGNVVDEGGHGAPAAAHGDAVEQAVGGEGRQLGVGGHVGVAVDRVVEYGCYSSHKRKNAKLLKCYFGK